MHDHTYKLCLYMLEEQAIYILQYVQVSSGLNCYFFKLLCTKKHRHTDSQTDRHEYSMVAVDQSQLYILGTLEGYSLITDCLESIFTQKWSIKCIFVYYPVSLFFILLFNNFHIKLCQIHHLGSFTSYYCHII